MSCSAAGGRMNCAQTAVVMEKPRARTTQPKMYNFDRFMRELLLLSACFREKTEKPCLPTENRAVEITALQKHRAFFAERASAREK
jgi:hypothetical protein